MVYLNDSVLTEKISQLKSINFSSENVSKSRNKTLKPNYIISERVRIRQTLAEGVGGHREGRPAGRHRGEVLPGGSPTKRSQREEGQRIRVGPEAFRIGEFIC